LYVGLLDARTARVRLHKLIHQHHRIKGRTPLEPRAHSVSLEQTPPWQHPHPDRSGSRGKGGLLRKWENGNPCSRSMVGCGG